MAFSLKDYDFLDSIKYDCNFYNFLFAILKLKFEVISLRMKIYTS